MKYVNATLKDYEKWLPKKKEFCHEIMKEARNNEGPRPDKFPWPRCDGTETCCKVMIIGDNLNACSSANTNFRTGDRTRIVFNVLDVFLGLWLHDIVQFVVPGEHFVFSYVSRAQQDG